MARLKGCWKGSRGASPAGNIFAASHYRIRLSDPGCTVWEVQQYVYQTQLQRRQDRLNNLIINDHVPHVNDPGKHNIFMIIVKNTIPENIPTISVKYRDNLLQQKDDGLKHSIHIIGSK